MDLKNTIKALLHHLHLDLTRNLKYDRLTKLLLKKILNSGSNCIDVGSFKGEILDVMIQLSPNGNHFAFEPLPLFATRLKKKYKNYAEIFAYALSDQTGHSEFQFVKNAPAYSGLKKRRYDIKSPEIEEITVETKTLDEVIPSDLRIDFIKIDVEGGELGVLRGGKQLLQKYKPVILFECGLGASDYYGTSPSDVYNFLTKEISLQVSLLHSFLKREKSLALNEFEDHFNTNDEYYFIAHKQELLT